MIGGGCFFLGGCFYLFFMLGNFFTCLIICSYLRRGKRQMFRNSRAFWLNIETVLLPYNVTINIVCYSSVWKPSILLSQNIKLKSFMGGCPVPSLAESGKWSVSASLTDFQLSSLLALPCPLILYSFLQK